VKLWEKGMGLDARVERFTVGNDPVLDERLVVYDCIASMAHVEMLGSIGVLTPSEVEGLTGELTVIKDRSEEGSLVIGKGHEDCHSAIECHLVRELGDTGKKVHTARSRNDQVLTALRLWEKDALVEIERAVVDLSMSIHGANETWGHLLMPGYTHTKRAMPTTVGTWLGAFVDALVDDLHLLEAASKLIDASPLGTVAGFGVPVFDVDRSMTARKMGFASVMENPIYAQHSRGKFDSFILDVLTSVMLDMNRLATDIITFSSDEYGFILLPHTLCTGSSIMPHKKNPDVLELVRSHYHGVMSDSIQVKGVVGNLISGYHRDVQTTKAPVMHAFDTTRDCLEVMSLIVEGMSLEEGPLTAAMTPDLYATEEAYTLVKEGMPFRDAYRKVGERFL